MRGPHRLAALLLILAIGGGAFAAAATAKPRYSKLTVEASYSDVWDYGSDPESIYNRGYIRSAGYQLKAIAKHEGRSLSIAGRSALVAGSVLVFDTITVRQPGRAPDFEPRHALRECRNPKVPADPHTGESVWVWHTATGGGDWGEDIFKRSRDAGLRVNDGSLFIDAGGTRDFWDPACHGTTESYVRHGLQSTPVFELPAPKGPRFKGKKPFKFACSDSFNHEMPTASDGSAARNGHSYLGSDWFRARFRPFPSKKLEKMKERHKKGLGTEKGRRGAAPDKACPRESSELTP